MEMQTLTALVALITLVAIATWRFTKVEMALKSVIRKVDSQHDCQAVLAKEIGRVNVTVKATKAALIRHLKKEEG